MPFIYHAINYPINIKDSTCKVATCFLSFCFATCAGWLYKCLTSLGFAQAQYFNKDWMNGFWIMFWRQPKHKSNSMIQPWQCYIYLLLLALPAFIICLPASLSEEMRSIDLHESFWRWKLTFITIIFDLCYLYTNSKVLTFLTRC